MSKRMTLELTDRVSEDLESIIESGVSNAKSRAQAIRNAIALYRIAIDAAEDGDKIIIEASDEKKKDREIVLT